MYNELLLDSVGAVEFRKRDQDVARLVNSAPLSSMSFCVIDLDCIETFVDLNYNSWLTVRVSNTIPTPRELGVAVVGGLLLATALTGLRVLCHKLK